MDDLDFDDVGSDEDLPPPKPPKARSPPKRVRGTRMLPKAPASTKRKGKAKSNKKKKAASTSPMKTVVPNTTETAAPKKPKKRRLPKSPAIKGTGKKNAVAKSPSNPSQDERPEQSALTSRSGSSSAPQPSLVARPQSQDAVEDIQMTPAGQETTPLLPSNKSKRRGCCTIS